MAQHDYPFKVRDRIHHISDDAEGVIVSIDTNMPHPTTCRVLWDDAVGETDITDIQWTNKLVKVA